MTCPDCTAASTDAHWPGYSARCPDCEIRAIASSPRAVRECRYEQIESQCGLPAAQEVRRRVREEIARILELKGKA